jgi:cation diffusion facilitator family transporter
MNTFEKDFNAKKKAAWLSLIIGIGMFVAKMAAYILTGSSAIFSDAAESVVHVAATSMALYSIYLSAKPADENHLYGHGNIEYFSAGIEGLLILIAAITIIYYSVHDIIEGVKTQRLDIGTMIIAAAGIINLFLGLFLVRKGKLTNSITLIADGKHVLTDSYTSIGVVIGLVLVLFTKFLLLDPLMAILVASNILYTGFKLVRESIGGLMNETDAQTLEKLSALLRRIKKSYWIDIHHLRFMKSGDRIFVDFHLILPFYFSVKESHLEENYTEEYLLSEFPNSGVRIHMDYCKDETCKFCEHEECKFRKEPKSVNHTWSISSMIGNPIYVAFGKR